MCTYRHAHMKSVVQLHDDSSESSSKSDTSANNHSGSDPQVAPVSKSVTSTPAQDVFVCALKLLRGQLRHRARPKSPLPPRRFGQLVSGVVDHRTVTAARSRGKLEEWVYLLFGIRPTAFGLLLSFPSSWRLSSPWQRGSEWLPAGCSNPSHEQTCTCHRTCTVLGRTVCALGALQQRTFTSPFPLPLAIVLIGVGVTTASGILVLRRQSVVARPVRPILDAQSGAEVASSTCPREFALVPRYEVRPCMLALYFLGETSKVFRLVKTSKVFARKHRRCFR